MKQREATRLRKFLRWPHLWTAAIFIATIIHIVLWWIPIQLSNSHRFRPKTVNVIVIPQPRPVTPQPPAPRPPKRRKLLPRRRYRPKKITSDRTAPKKRITPTPTPTPRPQPIPKHSTTKDPPPPLKNNKTSPKKQAVLKKKFNLTPYIQQVMAALNQEKNYPPIARRMEYEGITTLSLRLSREGKLIEVKLIKSSGYRILDREAFRMVHAVHFPSLPSNYKQSFASFLLPVVFSLDSLD